jgi:predicted AAA+ superfamily ATPase
VQVSADVTEAATRQRELRALEEAMKGLGIERGTLVTLREEGRERLGSGEVRIVPAWRWFLEEEPRPSAVDR